MKCAFCETEFEPKNGMQKYCNSRCREAAKRADAGVRANGKCQWPGCDNDVAGDGCHYKYCANCRKKADAARSARGRERKKLGLQHSNIFKGYFYPPEICWWALTRAILKKETRDEAFEMAVRGAAWWVVLRTARTTARCAD